LKEDIRQNDGGFVIRIYGPVFLVRIDYSVFKTKEFVKNHVADVLTFRLVGIGAINGKHDVI
jgi:hypothetical protein